MGGVKMMSKFGRVLDHSKMVNDARNRTFSILANNRFYNKECRR